MSIADDEREERGEEERSESVVFLSGGNPLLRENASK